MAKLCTFFGFKTGRHDITGILLKVALYTIPVSLLVFLMFVVPLLVLYRDYMFI